MTGRPPGPLPEKHTEYTIVPGDTMWQIARTNGLTLAELTTSNPHLEKDPMHPGGDPWHWIYPGEIVHIPPVPDRSAPSTSHVSERVLTDQLTEQPPDRSLNVMLSTTELRQIELAAHVAGEPMTAFARAALLAHVESLKSDEAFRGRVKALIETDREILERLRG
jgi:hypothetical protein